jgi:phospholipid transport system substrate-binding protein
MCVDRARSEMKLQRACIVKSLRMAVFVFVALLFSIPGRVWAGEPTDQLSGTVNRLTGMLASAPRAALTSDELPERVAKVIYERFDFAEMARLSLGKYWEGISEDERREFVQVFTTYVLRVYKSTLNSYNGEKISYEREVQEGDHAQVDTKVMAKNKPVLVDYKLRRQGDDWKIYDIAIEQVSVTKNFHAQFTRVISESSFKDLIQRMRAPATRS